MARPRCRTSTCCSPPRGLRRPSRRALRGRGRRSRPGRRSSTSARTSSPAARRATARRRRATTSRPPTGSGSSATSSGAGTRRGSTRTPSGPRRAARELRGLAVRAPVLAALAALGPVLAWNVFVLLTFVAAGLLTFAWLRELGLGRGPALAGGLVFAIAPYRAIAERAGHLLGPISLLLPLALWAFERAAPRVGGVARALRRGDRVDPALRPGAPRARGDPVLLPLRRLPVARAAACCSPRPPSSSPGPRAGLLVQHVSIAGSISAGGRSLGSVALYSARAARLRHAARAARERELRLPRLARAARSRSPASRS